MSQLKALLILLGLLNLTNAFLINGYINCDGPPADFVQAELSFRNISIPLDSIGHFQLEVPDNTLVFFRILHPGCQFEATLFETYPGCKTNYHFQGVKKNLWTRKVVLLLVVILNLLVIVAGCLMWWFKEQILKWATKDDDNADVENATTEKENV